MYMYVYVYSRYHWHRPRWLVRKFALTRFSCLSLTACPFHKHPFAKLGHIFVCELCNECWNGGCVCMCVCVVETVLPEMSLDAVPQRKSSCPCLSANNGFSWKEVRLAWVVIWCVVVVWKVVAQCMPWFVLLLHAPSDKPFFDFSSHRVSRRPNWNLAIQFLRLCLRNLGNDD